MGLKDLKKTTEEYSYIQGGRKLGVYNGDIKTGTYIDIHGRFINKDGFAIDEDGYIMLDDKGNPIEGDTPSYIPINEYEPDYNIWLSEYEKRKKKWTTSNPESLADKLLMSCYFDIFNIHLDVPDEIILAPNAFIRVWKHYMHTCKTVQVSWANVFRTGDL